MKSPFKRWNLPEARIYLAVILFFAAILTLFDYRIGGMAFVVFLILLFYNWKMSKRRRKNGTVIWRICPRILNGLLKTLS